ncbi:glycosyltransferase family 2 protein [Methanoculleus bourgensis]|uniref:glycosyltransferase family 2 protein n=1 Tax=Methanoculleus bourgensis TaxID=83986 RepID=UPI002FD966E0
MPRASIIILNWNGWTDTIECLESLYQINYPNYDVIVVDNGSKDGSIKKMIDFCDGKIEVKSNILRTQYETEKVLPITYDEDELDLSDERISVINELPSDKRVIIIMNRDNYGFAKGNNIGIKYALNILKSDYILLLNNDTVVDSNFLNKLIESAESDKNIAIIGPKCYYYDYNGRTDVINSAGGKINFLSYPYFKHTSAGQIETASDRFTGVDDCDWITGAALMICKSAPIKSLNTEFFFGGEDIDLCINTKKKGFRIVVDLDAKIWHKKGVARRKAYNDDIRETFRCIRVDLRILKIHNAHYLLIVPVSLLQIMMNISPIKEMRRKVRSYFDRRPKDADP